LDTTGLVYSLITAATGIDSGRKGFATRGKEQEGRISYEKGVALAMTAFKEAQTTADSHTTLLSEYTFLTQEKEFYDKSDNDSLNSLTQALLNFDDAFIVLGIVDDKATYQIAEKFYPHHKNYRTREGYPKDAFHVAIESHKTRIKNMLRTPGIDPLEKALLKQRLENLSTAQKSYKEKQKKALQ
jgi:hypothetical protein